MVGGRGRASCWVVRCRLSGAGGVVAPVLRRIVVVPQYCGILKRTKSHCRPQCRYDIGYYNRINEEQSTMNQPLAILACLARKKLAENAGELMGNRYCSIVGTCQKSEVGGLRAGFGRGCP